MKKEICITIVLLVLSLVGSDAYSQNNDTSSLRSFSLIIESQQAESTIDKILSFVKDILGPLVALLGILLTIPILKKKLLENHITNALNKIQESNSAVKKKNQELIDGFTHVLNSKSKILTKEEVESCFTELTKVFYLSLDGSSDVTSLLYYLRETIRSGLAPYKPDYLIFGFV